MADRELGRTLTFVGAILGILGGVLLILAGLVGGVLVTAASYSHISFLSIGTGTAIVFLIIYGLIQIIISYAMIEVSKRHKKGDHIMNGIIIIVLSLILFLLGGGFILGPILGFIGGLLIML